MEVPSKGNQSNFRVEPQLEMLVTVGPWLDWPALRSKPRVLGGRRRLTVLADSAMVHTDQAPKSPSRGQHVAPCGHHQPPCQMVKQIFLSTVKGRVRVPAPEVISGTDAEQVLAWHWGRDINRRYLL